MSQSKYVNLATVIAKTSSLPLIGRERFCVYRNGIMDYIFHLNKENKANTNYKKLIQDIRNKGCDINHYYGQLPLLIKLNQYSGVLDGELTETLFSCGVDLNRTWTDFSNEYGVFSYRHIPQYATVRNCEKLKEATRVMCENGLFEVLEKQHSNILYFFLGYYGGGRFEYIPNEDMVKMYLEYDKNKLIKGHYMFDPHIKNAIPKNIHFLILNHLKK